jgi:hypothetical protein
MVRRLVISACLSLVVVGGVATARAETVVDLLGRADLRPLNVGTARATLHGRPALAVRDAASEQAAGDEYRLVVIPGSRLRDGTIEVDLAGDVAPDSTVEGARGFVGVAFHVSPDARSFEAFYLRPTNPRSDDQVRRNHSVQYISLPGYSWRRLRAESPERYESYADLQPGVWTHVKIEVEGRKARLFVNGAEQPALIVNDLKQGDAEGDVALWIGPGTLAHFGSVRLAPR